MRDRLIAHRPKVKPEDDHWMLDRWTPVEAHALRDVCRDVKDGRGVVVEVVYRVICDCGWRSSVEWQEPLAAGAVCPVGAALRNRALVKRGNDRIEWKEVVVQPK